MEIKAFQETILSCGEAWGGQFELPVEAELLIPDYQPPVFKIIKTIVIPVVLQKHSAERKLALEGYLRCCIFYQSEDGQELCQVEQKLPFSKTLELPEGKIQDEQISVSGEVEYMNCRATHSRRLELRGGYTMSLSALPQLPEQVVTALAESGLEQKITAMDWLELLPYGDKVISCKEELQLPGPVAEVLHISGRAELDEIHKLAGKAVVKGKVTAEILYRVRDEQMLKTQEVVLPVRQTVDLDGIEEDTLCWADMEPISWTLEALEEDQKAELSLTGMFRFHAWRHKRLPLAQDAFSVTHQVNVDYIRLRLERPEQELAESIHCTAEATLEEGSTVLGTVMQLAPPVLIEAEETACAGGKGVLYLFVRNSAGEMECREAPFEYRSGKTVPEQAKHLELQATAQAGPVTVRVSGCRAEAEFPVLLNGLLLNVRPFCAMKAIEQGQPLEREEDAPALHIYYAKAGQSLFSIAKSLCASPRLLKECNGLSEDTLAGPARLLVPRAN